MLQDFVKKKFSDYSRLVSFTDGRTDFRAIRESGLPAFILNFIDCSLPDNKSFIEKNEFEGLLNKAIVFNVNYIIKPKNTILKFLFGDVETRPVEFINRRLAYFQFYGYYVNHINDFISMNSLEVLSVNQIEHIINDINNKLLEEISDVSNGDSQRLNLVKLLYYFFVDLTDNNPINIKLPKKILSVFLNDKGFTDIKAKVDSFFSDEIFIQEAMELMNPGAKKRGRTKMSDVGMSESQVKEIVSKAKTNLISKESSNKDVASILEPSEKAPDEEKLPDVKKLRQSETKMPELDDKTLVIEEEIYSNDLLFASQFSSIIPEPAPSETEVMERILIDLFCEVSYRKKIIKRIFHRNESSFRSSAAKILGVEEWTDAIPLIEEVFRNNKVDIYSEEAVKFVDLLQSHFTKTTGAPRSVYSNHKQQGT